MYTILFFDDSMLHNRSNLSRKTGTPTIIEEGTFEDPYIDTAWGYPSVVFDEISSKWRCYYQGELGSPHNQAIHVMAESDDGINWQIPDLSKLVKIQDRLTPHQIYPNLNEWCGLYTDSNFHTKKDGALTSSKYKMLASRRQKNWQFSKKIVLTPTLLTSSDGIQWHDTDIRWHPYSADPGYFVYWNSFKKSYVITLRPEHGDRRIAISETKDWKTFTKPEIILQTDPLDTEASLFYGMPVIEYDQMFIGLLWIYHVDPTLLQNEKFPLGSFDMEFGDDLTRIMGKIDCQLSYSVNGIHFQRSLRDPFIQNSDPGKHGSGCIYPSSLVPYKDTLRIYSSSSKGEHAQIRFKPELKQSAILVHEIRKDGFVYLEPSGGTGELTTKWLLIQGDNFSINTNVPNGEILVQIMDHVGNPIEGYEYENCIRYSGDSLNWKPMWSNNNQLSKLKNRIIKIGIKVTNGRIYAIRGNFELFQSWPEVRRYINSISTNKKVN